MGAKLDTSNPADLTPLQIACTRGYDTIAALLLAAFADPDYIGQEVGLAAINYAAQYGHFSIVKLLLENGASIVHPSMEDSALHSAVHGGQTKIAR